MTLSPGEVLLEARWSGGRLSGPRAVLRRPALLRGMRGRDPQAVATLLPLAYSVCAQAQRAACNAALAAAAGADVAPGPDPAVRSEAVRELLLASFTGAARPLAAATLRAGDCAAALRGALERDALGCDIDRWLELRSVDGLRSLLPGNTAPLALEAGARLALWEPPPQPAAWLPMMDAAGSLAGCPVLDEATCAAPTWQGACAQTGPVARMRAHPLVADLAGRPWLQCWLARLLELLVHARGAAADAQDACSLGAVSAVSPGEGVGRSAVVTARGLLMHEVHLAPDGRGGRVASRYAACAPTEWNFHPQGLLPRWLEGAAAGSADEARRLLLRAAEALDPCVECRVEVGEP